MSWFRGPAVEVAPSSTDDTEELSTKGPYGLQVCHDDDDAVADIVFVHGLTGNRINTWASKAEKVFWPQDLLPKKLPKTRIMTYGYDADIAHFWAMASQNRIGEHAGNLVNAITQLREDTDTEGRPIIFVCHSLGGLVTEDALLHSKNSAEPHLRDLVKSVVGICFLGTPHCGSDLAKWGSIMGSLVNTIKKANVDLVNVLKVDSEVLARVQREFHTMLRGPTFEQRPALKITCFFEELPVRMGGEVVPKHSAILPSYNAIGIRQNHMDMTKFTNGSDPGYLSVSRELSRWVKAIATEAESTRPLPGSNQGFQGQQWRQPPPSTDRLDHFYDSYRGAFSPPQNPHYPPSEHHPTYQRENYSNYQSPDYQPHRFEGGYSRPLPPPEPRYLIDARAESSPPPQSAYADPRWGSRSPQPPQTAWDHRSPPPPPEPSWSHQPTPPQPNWSHSSQPQDAPSSLHQGSHMVSGHTNTYAGGKTLQGMNVNAGGDVTL